MDAIIEDIYNNPSDWRSDQYNFTHKTGISFWTANGFFFFSEQTGVTHSFIDKIRAYRAYRWWCKNAPLEALAVRGHQ